MTAPVLLTVAEDSFLVGAVGMLDRFVDGLGDHATVGGIAVIVRVAAVHRATGDIDSADRQTGSRCQRPFVPSAHGDRDVSRAAPDHGAVGPAARPCTAQF